MSWGTVVDFQCSEILQRRSQTSSPRHAVEVDQCPEIFCHRRINYKEQTEETGSFFWTSVSDIFLLCYYTSYIKHTSVHMKACKVWKSVAN
jgi:hypothetical protein